MLKNLVTSRVFWFGFVAGIVTYQVVLPRFAPGLKAKLPLS
jgi:hypothetical protein